MIDSDNTGPIDTITNSIQSEDTAENVPTPSPSENSIDANTQNTMNVVFEAAKRILDGLQVGEKTTLRDLIDKVVAETKTQVSIANGLVPMFVHSWEKAGNGVMKRGRTGGIFKGARPSDIRVDPRPRCETCNQVIRFDKKPSDPKLAGENDITTEAVK